MNFQLRHNLLITIFIIVIIAVMWLLMKGLSYSYDQLSAPELVESSQEQAQTKKTTYVEKIDNFALQEFNALQNLSHFVEADNYYNFKDEPALLVNPKVTTYNENGELNYVLTSKRAHYLDSGEVSFKGEVDVSSSSGMRHKMNTEELLVDTNTDNLLSRKKVTYLGERAKILSQGMSMQAKADKMQLTGDTVIHQDGGQKMLTKDLHVDQSNQKKHYYSNNKTTYLSAENKIYAQGLDMQDDTTQLLGKVSLLQNSGSNIQTKNITVDQTDGAEVYQTNDGIHYQSTVADIRAQGMHYDAAQQKIKFTGGVVGQYD